MGDEKRKMISKRFSNCFYHFYPNIVILELRDCPGRFIIVLNLIRGIKTPRKEFYDSKES